jgi:hypothetical protein
VQQSSVRANEQQIVNLKFRNNQFFYADENKEVGKKVNGEARQEFG